MKKEMLQFEELEKLEVKLYEKTGMVLSFVEDISKLVIDGIGSLDSEKAAKIVEALKDEGYNEFALADSSSGLMDELFAFTEAGCEISGTVKFNQVRKYGNCMIRSKEIKTIMLKIK